MINLLLGLVAGVVIAVAITLSGFPLVAGIIPGTLVFIGAYIGLAFRTGKKLQAVVKDVQAELSSIGGNQKEAKVKADKSIKMLEAALPLARWQFLIEGEVQSQIGMIKFLFKDHDGAMAAFAKSSSRNYLTRAFAASVHYQRQKFDLMEKAFEDAVKSGKKDGMVWAAYAWCLQQQKKDDEALKVLARAVEANPSDEKLKSGLTALQNGKKLKMKAWEPMWWQFGLEGPPMQQPQFIGGGRRARFMRR